VKDAKITALSPWFGSKRNLAPTIVSELGEHRVYWEPFCGSMAVLLNKPPTVMETVNDLHGDLINLARVVQCESLGPRFYRRLRRMPMAEQLHREAAERHRARGYAGDGPPDIDAAVDYFLCAWLGRNGVAGTQSYNQGFRLRFTASGGKAATRWSSVVDSIPAWRRRLRNVMIICRDGFDLLPRIEDDFKTSIYVDPPYFVKGAKYVHDADDTHPMLRQILGLDADAPLPTFAWHRALAVLLRRFERARVVLSYYPHPLLDELYPDWTRREIEISKALAHQGGRGVNDVRATELLLLNGRSFANSQSQLF
jgi:DNA adenine methylase